MTIETISLCITLIIVVVYYVYVLGEITSEYYSPIQTKKDAIIALIPLYLWVKIIKDAYNKLT